jgi:hypothetical protein
LLSDILAVDNNVIPFPVSSTEDDCEVIPGVIVNVSIFVGQAKLVDKDVRIGLDFIKCIYFFLK